MKQKITPEVSKCSKHEAALKKFRTYRRRLRITLCVVAIIYVPLGAFLTGHALYTQATQLMAKEPDVYITEERIIEDKLVQYIEEERENRRAEFEEQLDVVAEKAARERLKRENDAELEKLNRKALGFE